MEGDCVLRGTRIVVPPPARESLLHDLHEGHPGMSRMKELARSFMWWPNIDADIEHQVQQCDSCQRTRPAPSRAPLHPWEMPRSAWERIHVDYTGPLDGQMLLIVVDAYSKWLDVSCGSSCTSARTISDLKKMFSTHGVPCMLVSDNGPAFSSEEFRQFCVSNGIRHVKVAAYHPSSNGLAERAVRTVKGALSHLCQTTWPASC